MLILSSSVTTDMDLIKISQKLLLQEVTDKLGLLPPIYGLQTEDGGLWRAYVDLALEQIRV